MKYAKFLPLIVMCFGVTTTVTNCKKESAPNHAGVIDNSQSPYTKLRSIPIQDTRLTDGFWAERFELAANKMLPTLENTMLGEGTANLNRIKEAAGLIQEHEHGSPWGDGDNYKWIESMAHVYNLNEDPELDKKMDYWIDIIGKAQDPDGYISTNIGHDTSKRFQRVNAHEMYNMGHLLTAACIHYRSTGKENFMDIAKKNADFLYNQWKAEPVHMARYPWNPSAFMGMAEMYRSTRDPKYLELLQIMIDNRGSRPNPDRDHSMGGTDQTQDRVPLRQESLAVGHAVTGNYYYCGAADLYAENGDQEILEALERIWKDIHWHKTDIIVGVAKDRHGESLSPRGDEVHENFANTPYEQPNFYNETCANIGTGMFDYRMFMLTANPEYADWTEQMMYNTLNSAVDLEGEHWFYANPLSWDGTEGEKIPQTNGRDPKRMVPAHRSGQRWEFMNCYCCPPSVTRTTAKIHNWFYNISDDGALWINFYGGNELSTTLADGTKIALTQTTDYPWDGKIVIDIKKIAKKDIPIHLRIPKWTENAVVMVNGEKPEESPQPGTYLKIERKWSAGDEIIMDFPMPVRLMEANPKAINLNSKVAVMRGPVVYCFEVPNQDGGEEIVKNGVYLPANIKLSPEYREDFLGGLTVLKGKALNRKEKEAFVKNNPQQSKEQSSVSWEEDELYLPLKSNENEISGEGSVDIELIPYYAWANRGLSYMDIWMPLAN
ncbi:MAG: beta-L-arabinofuranosidase domain-containing protein [Bacteroidales bacterium]